MLLHFTSADIFRSNLVSINATKTIDWLVLFSKSWIIPKSAPLLPKYQQQIEREVSREQTLPESVQWQCSASVRVQSDCQLSFSCHGTLTTTQEYPQQQQEWSSDSKSVNWESRISYCWCWIVSCDKMKMAAVWRQLAKQLSLQSCIPRWE